MKTVLQNLRLYYKSSLPLEKASTIFDSTFLRNSG